MDRLFVDQPDDVTQLIVYGSAIVSAVLFAGLAVIYRAKLKWWMGGAEFKFGDSWASSLTLVGALLGTVLSSEALPDTMTPVSTVTLAGLSLLFGVMTLIAPLLFSATMSPREIMVKTTPNDPAKASKVSLGYVLTFLIAGFVTVWAVLGQLGTVGIVLLPELVENKALSKGSAGIFQLLIGIALCLAVVHAFRSSRWTIEDISRQPSDRGTVDLWEASTDLESAFPQRWTVL